MFHNALLYASDVQLLHSKSNISCVYINSNIDIIDEYVNIGTPKKGNQDMCRFVPGLAHGDQAVDRKSVV